MSEFPWLTIGNSSDDGDYSIVPVVIVTANYGRLAHQYSFIFCVYKLVSSVSRFFVFVFSTSVFGKEQKI